MKNRIIDELLAAGWKDPPADVSKALESGETMALQSLKRTQEMIEEFVASRPALCLGIAVAAGITLGWWIKRK